MELDPELAREEHVRVARRLVSEHPTWAPSCWSARTCRPTRPIFQRETGRPVFDITSLVRMAHDALAAGRSPRPA